MWDLCRLVQWVVVVRVVARDDSGPTLVVGPPGLLATIKCVIKVELNVIYLGDLFHSANLFDWCCICRYGFNRRSRVVRRCICWCITTTSNTAFSLI